MKLTIEQALQQGIAAHKEGKLQEAERLYRAILLSQPGHPDANHNLGVLAVAFNKADAALPLFKSALEANPKIEQFWLSYIDTLIKEQQFESAKQVLEQAKTLGVAKQKLNSLEAKLSPTNQKPNAGRVSPPQELLNSLLRHYQSGRLGDAEKLCIEITKGFPKHPFAWKALGAVLKATGRKSEAVDANQTAVALSPLDAEAYSNLSVTLKELERLEEAEASYRHAIALKPDYAEVYYNLGNMLQRPGELEEAAASYNRAIALKPDYAEAHNNLGNTLQELGRLDEAVDSYNQAIALKPELAEAHNNLGNTLKELGKLDEAVDSYNQAIALKPDYAEAHNNLGVTLKQLGRSDGAVDSYNQAIALKPDYAEAHNNLGVILKDLGRLNEAVASYNQAIAFRPDYAEAHVNLAIAIKSVEFNSSNRKLYPPLLQMLTNGNFTRPSDVASSILSLLKHDVQIKDLLLEKNFAKSLNEARSIIESLDKLPLLHQLMRVCPLPDLQFERLFVHMRKFILTNLGNIEASPEFIYFLSTLSIQCFINEYVYVESDEETHLIGELQTTISQTAAQSKQPEAIKILCFASYRSLYQYDWCQKLESLDNFEEVKKTLIKEPILEKMIAKDIPVLEEISNNVSLQVREQYEESPYPRWIKLRIPLKAKSISEVCTEKNLYLHSESIKNVTAPTILIAGCGTGQHSIETASRFSGCHVTAVDLSLTSLAYAQRESTKLRLTNIAYLQADILHLHKMGKEFDIIESSGVVHHMEEPMAGWKVLVDLLKPGGLMKIGLYSELARHHVVAVRKEIAALGLGTSEAEIKKFRQSLAESHHESHHLVTSSSDFYSLSTVRDLIFHVQEHRFTLPQIKNCLNELGLKFCGFENKDVISNFRELHGKEADIYDLELWHQYEERNPQAFAAMYQFWCQKP